MNQIKLMTDSASDIPQKLEQELNIEILHFPLEIQGESYMEREDFTNEEFYQMLLTSDTIPTHSQITSFRFEEKYEEFYKAGYETLIYCSINQNGSATYQNALMARDSFYESHPEAKERFRIEVIDSKTYTYAYGYAVVEAAKMAKNGADISAILAFLNDWFDTVEIYFVPLTLDFVKKSGRVSCAAAFVGELLGLRPIITFIDGEVTTLSKVRGDKAVPGALMKCALNAMTPNTPYFFIEGTTHAQVDALRREMEKTVGRKSEGIYSAGATISINAGPKIMAICVKGKHKHHN